MDYLYQLLQDNPGVAAALAAFMAGTVPVWLAARSAMVRRINQAWPDDTNMSHPQKVEHTVKKLHTTLLPDSVVASAVRSHKKE